MSKQFSNVSECAMNSLANANQDDSTRRYADMDADARELLKQAAAVRAFAYAPYSNHSIGAAFRCIDGNSYAGCTMENAAFTPTTCAERVAIGTAISAGVRKFTALAVVGGVSQGKTLPTPCGVCRQIVMEFAAEDIPIYVTCIEEGQSDIAIDAEVLCTSIFNLLPSGFRTFK